LLRAGPQIVEAKAGGPLQTVKPFTEDVRANIDDELVNKSIDFMRRQKAAGMPFFLYLPSPWGTSEPAFPTVQGQITDRQLRRQADGRGLPRRPDPRHAEQLGIDDNTIVVFASDNGPQGKPHANTATRERRTWAIPVRSAES